MVSQYILENKNSIFVHESAFVDANVEIGLGTKIWHFSHIMSNSKIGLNCNLGQNVFVASKSQIGNGVKIQNNVSIYEGVFVEDDVFIGPSVVFTNVSRPRAFISQNTSAHYQITTLQKGCTIGANATIVCGVSLGKYSFVAAGAVVTKNVPDFALVAGTPAKVIQWVGIDGLKLIFDQENQAKDSLGNYFILQENQVKLL